MKYIPPLNGDTEDPNRSWIDANPEIGVAGSRMTGPALEHPQREILAAITGAGLVPDEGNLAQLWAAIQAAGATAASGKVAKAGDTMTGALVIALAALQLTLRHTDNTAALMDHLRLFRGTGAGTRASIQTLGDAANGLSEIDVNFLSAANALVKAFKFKNSGRLEVGADPTLALEVATKQYADAVVPDGTTSVKGKVQLVSTAVDTTLANAALALTAKALDTLFARSLGSPGYVTLPGGLIIQYGFTTAISAGATLAVTLPTAYPAAHHAVLANFNNYSGGVTPSYGAPYMITAADLTSFTIKNGGSSASQYSWISLGK